MNKASGSLRMAGLLAALALAMLACTAAPHTFPSRLYADPSFTTEELGVIQAVLNEWSIATGGLVDDELMVGEAPPGTHRIQRISSRDLRARYRKKKGVLAWVHMRDWFGNENHGNIYVVHDRIAKIYDGEAYLRLLKHVVLHEYGHHLGLHHEPSERVVALMSPTIPHSVPCITDVDLAQFCSLGYACEHVAHTCDRELY
jgi:hypothetical protein